jgi:hypothetical protein
MILAAQGQAAATPMMNCATAMGLVAAHPGVEAVSILTDVASEWRSMDRQTVSSGHPALTSQMLAMPGVMNELARQCTDNPGQPLAMAATQVYLRVRAALEGY